MTKPHRDRELGRLYRRRAMIDKLIRLVEKYAAEQTAVSHEPQCGRREDLVQPRSWTWCRAS